MNTDTFMEPVKGMKDLKNYIKQISKMLTDVECELQDDLKQEKAMVRRTRICRDRFNYSVEICAIAHEDFIKQKTQFSEYNQAKEMVLSCVQQLEHIRKMIVTNKQQKKTAIRIIRKIINRMKPSPLPDDDEVYSSSVGEGGEGECGDVNELHALLEMTKQNHRTITKRLIEHQVHPIMTALRTRHILAYKLAQEKTIGEIIHHAENCRAFMLRCRWLALVEYCASSWWFETQKDPMDHSCYCVLAVVVGDEEYNRYNPKKHYTALIDQMMNEPVQIFVNGVEHHDGTQPVIEQMIFNLTHELSDKIFTEERVNAFENEQNDMVIRQLQQQYLESQYQEQEQYQDQEYDDEMEE